MKKQCAEDRGPGRPPDLEDGRRVNLYLDGDTLKKAAAIGGGNISLGIRRAIAASNVKKPKV